jgi:DNA ligase-1
MKTFNTRTLYKRTKTGAIQYWQITVALATYPTIYKESGQLGTNSPTQHKEEIREGKNIGKANETKPAEQAVSQAESDWKRKRDEGYKSLADLNIQQDGSLGFYRCDGLVGSLQEVLNVVLPQFNTDASGNVKPMLAKDVDWKKVQYPCYIQPKLDGVRCLMIVEPRSDGDLSIQFLSRSGKDYNTLDHIAVDVAKADPKETFILDGEIYSDELTFQEITQAVKKQYPNSLKLHFRAYDVVSDDRQTVRILRVLRLVEAIGSPFITAVETLITESHDYTKQCHNTWVQAGYEGAMLRLFDGHYAQGQRSSHLLKVKEFDETEFTFIRFETGQREEDLLAVCCVTDGRCFKAKVIGSREEKRLLAAKPEKSLEYKKYTVKHFGWTDDKLPRFPIGKSFRDYE